jgi:hypothetical protein
MNLEDLQRGLSEVAGRPSALNRHRQDTTTTLFSPSIWNDRETVQPAGIFRHPKDPKVGK